MSFAVRCPHTPITQRLLLIFLLGMLVVGCGAQHAVGDVGLPATSASGIMEGEAIREDRRGFNPAAGSSSSSASSETTTSTTTTTTTTPAPEPTRIPHGSTLNIIDYVMKPVVESEGTAVAVGMGMGVLVFIIYLVCLRYCFQDIGSERSRKWFKVPKHVEGHPGQQHGGFGGPGSLQGSASHLNGLNTLTGGDPAAEYQLRMLLNSMVTGSPAGGSHAGAAGSPSGGGSAPQFHNNSFNATAVRSESFRGGVGGAAAPQDDADTTAHPPTINSSSAPLAGSPPMAPPR